MDKLYEEERKARMLRDVDRLFSIQNSICRECKTDAELISNLKLLQNKRNQNFDCIKKLVELILKENKSKEFKETLLKEVLSGKMYLENERVELALDLAKEYSDSKDANKAYEILNNVPVETFTDISEKKKNMFIFQQFFLAFILEKNEESELILKKIRKSSMDLEDQIKYFSSKFMSKVSQNRYLEAARITLESQKVQPSGNFLTTGAFYCLTSSCKLEKRDITEEKEELLEVFEKEPLLDSKVRKIIKMFRNNFLLETDIKQLLKEIVSDYQNSFQILDSYVEWAQIEFNLRIIEKKFSKISIKLLGELLQWNETDLIEYLSFMVNEKFINLKVNQITGFIDFGNKDWKGSVNDVLDKIIECDHLIEMNK
ncbi:PSD12 [Hepatospora eriocheir]|uniref:PSD12 n=1 Tax=Hepatospora eriocheir TaxID=1081669 RepID=A0A1X0QJ63_9MICR|nr:PSD12 [Hepatospora eriocheir]